MPEDVEITDEHWKKVECGNNEVKFTLLPDGTYLRSDGDHGFTKEELFGPDLASAAFDCMPWNDMVIETITVVLKPREKEITSILPG